MSNQKCIDYGHDLKKELCVLSCRRCGYEAEVSHTFNWTNSDHYCIGECQRCGSQEKIPHSFNWIESDNSCIRKCQRCGHKVTQPHNWINSDKYCKVCENCGYELQTHSFAWSSSESQCIRICKNCTYSETLGSHLFGEWSEVVQEGWTVRYGTQYDWKSVSQARSCSRCGYSESTPPEEFIR